MSSEATERQRRDGMCWTDEAEPYNDGRAFKVVCRDARGVMVTIIADNYFGYCKKEVKTQISFAANLYGSCEEEHAGGALAFATYVLGQDFYADRTVSLKVAAFADAVNLLGRPGRAAARRLRGRSALIRTSTTCRRTLPSTRARDSSAGARATANRGWRCAPGRSTFCPPASASGWRSSWPARRGGWWARGRAARCATSPARCPAAANPRSRNRSPMSLLKGPVFVKDYHRDMDQVAEILGRDFSAIYRNRPPDERSRRPDSEPGAIARLGDPDADAVAGIHRRAQRLGRASFRRPCANSSSPSSATTSPEWGDNWREHFTVDRINGFLGHELKFDNQKLVSNYLRVGYDPDGSWRIYKLRPDFCPAEKVQMEDDITASVVLPRDALNDLDPEYDNPSVKLVANCERLLFQRPDDAIYRGVDTQAEADIAGPGNFLSNFEPITIDGARAMVEHVVEFDQYSEPMKQLAGELRGAARDGLRGFVGASARGERQAHRPIRAICSGGRTW